MTSVPVAWACTSCTFLHEGTLAELLTCTICEAARPTEFSSGGMSELAAVLSTAVTHAPSESAMEAATVEATQAATDEPSEVASLRAQVLQQQEQLAEMQSLMKRQPNGQTAAAPTAVAAAASRQASDEELPSWLAQAAEDLDMLTSSGTSAPATASLPTSAPKLEPSASYEPCCFLSPTAAAEVVNAAVWQSLGKLESWATVERAVKDKDAGLAAEMQATAPLSPCFTSGTGARPAIPPMAWAQFSGSAAGGNSSSLRRL